MPRDPRVVLAHRPAPGAPAALRLVIDKNPLFLVSAALALVGAWLLNPPQATGGRSLPLLFELLGAIQGYEASLLLAAFLLWRRGGLDRDVRNLCLVLAPFLLDVTFTASSAATSLFAHAGLLAASLLVLALFALTALELRIAAALAGVAFGGRVLTALLAGPALVATAPLASAWLAREGLQAQIGLVNGLGLAGAVLLFGAVAGGEAVAGGRAVARRLAPLVLGGALLHVSATTWAQGGALPLVVGPALIALGVALPPLAWPVRAARDGVTPLVLPALGALLCAAPDVLGGFGGKDAGAGASVATAVAGDAAVAALVVVYLLGFRRTGGFHFLAGALFASHLAWGDLAAVRLLEPFACLGLFAYGLRRGSHPALLATPLGLAALLTGRLGLLGGALDALLALDVLGLGVLAWAHTAHGGARVSSLLSLPRSTGATPPTSSTGASVGRGNAEAAGARARLAGALLLYLPGLLVAFAADDPAVAEGARWLAYGGVGLLLAVALFTRLRGYAYPALVPVSDGTWLLAPTSAAGWGVAVLAGAFVVVSLGVLLSLRRDAALAWLAGGGAGPPPGGPPRSLPAPGALHRPG